MKILLALDSRVMNRGGFLLLDLNNNSFVFQEHPFQENFRALGFRGFCSNGEMLYVVNCSALYFFQLDLTGKSGKIVHHLKTVRRPEWEIGGKAAANLHHVYYSRSRNKLFVANTVMDCLDEISLDGQWLGRTYLWDRSPALMEWGLNRNSGTADLVHINHIEEHNGKTYLTMGNINGTRKGGVLCYETGEMVLEGLAYPHDGRIIEDMLLFCNSETSELVLYDIFADYTGKPMPPEQKIPIRPLGERWIGSRQWLRGIEVSKRYIIVGASQYKRDLSRFDPGLVPSRLVFLDRQSRAIAGEIYLPHLEAFENPSIYTIFGIQKNRDDQIVFDAWSTPDPLTYTQNTVPLDLPDPTFSKWDKERHCFLHWDWVQGDGVVGVGFEKDGTSFHPDFSLAQQKAYLVSGEGQGSVLKPAKDAHLYPLLPSRKAHIDLQVQDISLFAGIRFFILEYDNEARLAVNAFEIESAGPHYFAFESHPETKSCRIVFRISGHGNITLRKIAVWQQK